METEFTPFTAMIGGGLIGLAAVLLMLVNGRIAGISGIFGRLIDMRQKGRPPWVLGFMVGLIMAYPLYVGVSGQRPDFISPLSAAPLLDGSNGSYILMGAAALLVGLGAGLANGCTSGHGVCGLSRLSARSLVSVICFMLSAFIATYILRHVFGA